MNQSLKMQAGWGVVVTVVVTVFMAFACFDRSPETQAARAINAIAEIETVAEVYPGYIDNGLSNRTPDRAITDEDRANAAEFVLAFCKGDIVRVQRLVDRLEGQNLASEKFCFVVNTCFDKAGIDFAVTYDNNVFAIGQKTVADKMVVVGLIPGKSATVDVWCKTENGVLEIRPCPGLTPGRALSEMGRCSTCTVLDGPEYPGR